MEKIKVIVVDDSALMRKIVSDMINDDEDLEVIDIAKNGQDLLNKLITKTADVITLDVEMPVMDGISTLKELKKLPIHIPVIMLSSITKQGTVMTMDCLENGAFDFVPKPGGSISLDISKVKEELIAKIKAAAPLKAQRIRINDNFIKPLIKQNTNIGNTINKKINAVVIGASTGGPKALYTVITALPKNLGVPVLVVQHMPVGFTKAFADRLNQNSNIEVCEAIDGEPIERNKVYIAPGGFHMEISNSKHIRLTSDPSIWGVRPAVDKLFHSAAEVYGSTLISIILTGMGKDGTNGTIEIKNSGGFTISEHKDTCTIYGMPKAAFETGKIDRVLKINEITEFLVKTIR